VEGEHLGPQLAGHGRQDGQVARVVTDYHHLRLPVPKDDPGDARVIGHDDHALHVRAEAEPLGPDPAVLKVGEDTGVHSEGPVEPLHPLLDEVVDRFDRLALGETIPGLAREGQEVGWAVLQLGEEPAEFGALGLEGRLAELQRLGHVLEVRGTDREEFADDRGAPGGIGRVAGLVVGEGVSLPYQLDEAPVEPLQPATAELAPLVPVVVGVHVPEDGLNAGEFEQAEAPGHHLGGRAGQAVVALGDIDVEHMPLHVGVGVLEDDVERLQGLGVGRVDAELVLAHERQRDNLVHRRALEHHYRLGDGGGSGGGIGHRGLTCRACARLAGLSKVRTRNCVPDRTRSLFAGRFRLETTE